jgi:serine/threonine-protein kinase HipA
MARPRSLGAWLYGTKVAELSSARPGEVVCRYSSEALERWPRNIPLLSCSLPLTDRPHRNAGVYFRGMLPEGQLLQALAAEANLATYDTFGLLARFGRDVAGAVVIAHEDPGLRPGSVAPYDAETLEAEVANIEDRPLAIYDDSELSLAGVQNKILLVKTDTGWGRPVGGRPSTHILKVEDRRFPGLVTMEAAGMRLARELGLTTVDVELVGLSGIDCLIVERFDRHQAEDGLVTRIHQEDVCQALGIDPSGTQGKAKYEAYGGPSLRDVASLLDRYADDPITELTHLVEIVTFTVCFGNGDAHGKNLSFLYEHPGAIQLAPLYDTVPTVMFEKLRGRAAMTVNHRVNLEGITLADVVDEAQSWALAADPAQEAATNTALRLTNALEQIEVPSDLAVVVRDRCQNFMAQP